MTAMKIAAVAALALALGSVPARAEQGRAQQPARARVAHAIPARTAAPAKETTGARAPKAARPLHHRVRTSELEFQQLG